MSSTIETPASGNAAGVKHRGEGKTARIPIKVAVVPAAERLPKPDWIRVRAGGTPRFHEIKKILREHNLHTVCEEASCPNIGECFGKGTATFMIMGDICTRRCPFCDVAHGRPLPLDPDEPLNLARTIAALRLAYVVVTSVDRDDLRDGGAGHFRDCIRKDRKSTRLNSSHVETSYAVFCLKKKKNYLWFVIIWVLNVPLLISTFCVSRVLQLILSIEAFVRFDPLHSLDCVSRVITALRSCY